MLGGSRKFPGKPPGSGPPAAAVGDAGMVDMLLANGGLALGGVPWRDIWKAFIRADRSCGRAPGPLDARGLRALFSTPRGLEEDDIGAVRGLSETDRREGTRAWAVELGGLGLDGSLVDVDVDVEAAESEDDSRGCCEAGAAKSIESSGAAGGWLGGEDIFRVVLYAIRGVSAI